MKQPRSPAKADRSTPHVDSVAELAFRVCRKSLKALEKSLRSAALKWEKDVEHVHQLRVRSRRASAAIRLFSDVIPKTHETWSRKTLKKIIKAAGQARDLDVLIEAHLPRAGQAAGVLGRIWRQQRKASQKPIVKLYKKLHRDNSLQKHTRALLADLQPSSITDVAYDRPACEDWAKSRILDISRQFFAAVPSKADVESLHQLRILGKRLRYTLDFLSPVLKTAAVHEARAALADLQTQLGCLQDHVEARSRLRQARRDVSKSSHRRILGRLIQQEDDQITQLVKQFQLRSESAGCQPIESCLETLAALVATLTSPQGRLLKKVL